MELNQNQYDYLSGLVEKRGNEMGYTDQEQYDSYVNLIAYMNDNNRSDYDRNNVISQLGGNWSDFVKLGSDEWRKNQQTVNQERLNNVKSVNGSGAGVVKPQKLEPYKFAENKDSVPQAAPSSDLLAEYGNNYFELITFDKGLNNGKDNGRVTLAGVLKDIPAFNMKATWEPGPAATISDTVKKFMTSPIAEMTTTLGGRDRAWMNLDEGTDRVYKATSKPTFSLSFKLYTNENIGSKSLTNYRTWIKALSLYTMPSVDAKVNINAMANNTLNGLYGCADLIGDVVDAAKDAFQGGEDGKQKDKDLIDKVTDAVTVAANTASDIIQRRDGEYRVVSDANQKNFYGAKLWYLKILPGIFKNPLIVYIDSWGVTYSKEINPDTLEPIWVEFNINCAMDQVASAPVWAKYLN
jgi:hypothetical protein